MILKYTQINMYYRERIENLPKQFVDTLDSIMSIIATLDDIEKVILFGSCSRGIPNEHSDIDLPLIMDCDKIGIPLKQMEQKNGTSIYKQFCFNGKKEIDLLFADKNIYANSTDPASVYKRIKRDGVVLYEQPF